MGTRHLIVVVNDEKYPVAQYGQWDGHPGGQGKTVLTFCRDHLATPEGRAMFREKLKLCRFVTEQEHTAMWASVGADDSGLVGMDVAEKFSAKWPQLSRDCGALVLAYVWNAQDNVLLKDETNFAADSLFCEWAYVVDLDAGMLEGYKGFQQEPLPATERFAHLYTRVERRNNDQYYPIRMRASWPLAALPTDDEFYAALNDPPEEE
jgi:hypothetical protein